MLSANYCSGFARLASFIRLVELFSLPSKFDFLQVCQNIREIKNIKILFLIVSLQCHFKKDQIVMPDPGQKHAGAGLIRHPEHTISELLDSG
jgi:hypothetical protein